MIMIISITNTNQRLRSARDNDRVIKCPNARDQSAFCTFHTFLVEVHVMQA